LILVAVCILLQQQAHTQTRYQAQIDSLNKLLAVAKEDSIRLNLMVSMMSLYERYKPEEGLKLLAPALLTAGRTNKKLNIARVKDKAGRLYWRMGKFNEAYIYHFAALDAYKEAGDTFARNYVLIEIGQDYLNDTKFSEANNYLSKALQLSRESADTVNMLKTYDKLIALYENLGNYAEASKATYAYLALSEAFGDKIEIAHATGLIAENFQTQGNNTEALIYFKQSLQLNGELGELQEQTHIYRSMGDIYLGMGDFALAENMYNAGLKLANSMENKRMVLPTLYISIGNAYLTRGNYTVALHYLLLTAGELKPISSNHTLATLYAEIGTVYTRLHKPAEAGKYFDSSIALCKMLNTKVPLEDYYSGRQLLDSATGHWKDAYNNYKQYVAIKDSTFSKETLSKMVSSQIQYETDKKETIARAEQEKKDIAATAEIKRQRNIRNASLLVLASVLLFSIIVYGQRNKLAREKKRSDQLVKDKELLLKEIHHRVKNNLEIVSSLLALQSAQIDDPNTKEAMLEGQNRVQSIGIVHQKLYQGKNLGTIEMKDYFINLGESILDSFGADKRVTIECAMDQLEVDIDTAVPLGLIVNELLTNTLKYAFPGGQPGTVKIKLQKQTGGALQLEVSDNGIGKSGITHGTGFGGQLVSLLTQQLSGTMKEEIKNGTSIYFEFKPTKAA